MNKKKNKRNQDVYVVRDSCAHYVYIFPATVGIRKFHGCVAWGAAWEEHMDVRQLRRNGKTYAEDLTLGECQARFGFYPRDGTAWLVEYTAKGKMKKSEVDIDFSN